MSKYSAKFYGKIVGGKLKLQQPHLIEMFFSSIPDDTPIVMSIDKEYATKSNQQLKYYFAVIIKQSSQELGYGQTADGRWELDLIFRQMFLTENAGTELEHQRELSELNTREMMDYIDNCIQTLSELGIVVPPPNRDWKLAKNENSE